MAANAIISASPESFRRRTFKQKHLVLIVEQKDQCARDDPIILMTNPLIGFGHESFSRKFTRDYMKITGDCQLV
jgi:hypothetical protein